MITWCLVRRAFLAALFLTAFASLFVVGARDAQATSFNPRANITLSDSRPNVSANILSEFRIDAPDANFAGVVGFTPRQWGVASAGDVDIGAVVGTLNSLATLGLVNAACATQIPVNFTFLNASVNTNNTINPLPPGQEDALAPLAADANNNGILDGAERYPSYLNTLFPGLQPKARLFAATRIEAASLWVVLNFVLFEPGVKLPQAPAAFDPGLGFPSVVILQDPTVPPAPSAITDFCSPLISNTTTLGTTQDNPATSANEGGKPFRTNPGPGTYDFITYSVSLRDADDDGIENQLDTCPYSADPGWDPRDPAQGNIVVPGVDDDGDGIPNSCDQNNQDGLLGVLDADGDGFLNRGDNCPQVANPDQKDSDNDGIGDACDRNPNSPDGHRHEVSSICTVVIAASGAPEPTCTNVEGLASVAQLPSGGGTEDTTADDTDDTTNGPGDEAAADDTVVAGAEQEAQVGVGPGAADAAGGPATGVGALAPAIGSIPAWAAAATAAGGTGLLSALAALVAAWLRRRP